VGNAWTTTVGNQSTEMPTFTGMVIANAEQDAIVLHHRSAWCRLYGANDLADRYEAAAKALEGKP
jgi:hypothetical protein